MRTWLLTVGMIVAPRLAFACPVCFGQSDAPMAIATNNGIMAMLVVVACVLACFGAFMFYLARRARLFADALPVARGAEAFAGQGFGLTGTDPREGTVRC